MKNLASFLFLLLAFDLVSTSPSSWYNYNTGNRYPGNDYVYESEEAEYVYDDTTSTPKTTTRLSKATTEPTTTATSTLQPKLKSTPAHETDADLIAMLGKMAADFILNGTDQQTNSSKQTPKAKSPLAEKTDADMIAAFVNEMLDALIHEIDHQPANSSKQTPKTKSILTEKTDADLITAFLEEMLAVVMDELDHQPANSSKQTPKTKSILAEQTDADMIAAFVKEVVAVVIDEIDHQTNNSTQTPKTKSTIAEKTDADMIAAFMNEVVAALIDELDSQTNSDVQTAHPKSESDTNMIGALVNEVVAVIDTIDSQIEKSMLISPEAKKTEEVKQMPATETSECAKSKKTEQTQVNPNCDLIQDYDIHQYHRQDHESWTVSFNLKNALRRVMSQKEAPSHYIVRYQKTDKINVGEMQFLVVPSSHRQNKIAVENLSPSVYDFQICAISASFKPSFLDESSFSWVKEAPIHRLRLKSGSKEKEAEANIGEKSGSAW